METIRTSKEVIEKMIVIRNEWWINLPYTKSNHKEWKV